MYVLISKHNVNNNQRKESYDSESAIRGNPCRDRCGNRNVPVLFFRGTAKKRWISAICNQWRGCTLHDHLVTWSIPPPRRLESVLQSPRHRHVHWRLRVSDSVSCSQHCWFYVGSYTPSIN